MFIDIITIYHAYFLYYFADGRTGDSCILGRELTYTRRKQTSECFNGLDFDRPIQKKVSCHYSIHTI